MICGVRHKALKLIPDERGRLMEILRSDEELFQKFGQLYMTTAYPGVVKGWHYHKRQIDNFAVVKGTIKLALYDSRPESKTYREVNEFFLGEHNPILVQIPCMVLHGFKGVGTEEAIVVNCPTEVYDYKEPDEFRVDAFSKEVPYDWDIKMH